MIQAIFLKPLVVLAFEDLPSPARHAVVHLCKASLDGNAAVLERCVLPKHVQSGFAILRGQGLASAFKRLPSAVRRPGKWHLPVTQSFNVLMRRHVTETERADHVENVQISVPPALNESRRVIPTEVATSNLYPGARV